MTHRLPNRIESELFLSADQEFCQSNNGKGVIADGCFCAFRVKPKAITDCSQTIDPVVVESESLSHNVARFLAN